ncbi:MAG: deoxyribodipyrimidine photo-lyase [Pseudomonadota bacterium]|nr:deoxyribodipyrimidine photo-lyase [Pseudomonadota bacterium]
MPSTALVWFRRDFRLHDNPALVAALHDADRVVAVYLHAPDEEAPWQPGAASNWWRHHSLAALATAIAERGGRLTLRRGDSLAMLRELIRETGAQSVHWNRLYEPAIRARDEQIKAALKADGIIARSHNSALLFEPWSLKTQADQPYRVFSPFWRNGEPQLVNARTPEPLPNGDWAGHGLDSLPLDALGLLPTIAWDAAFADHWTPGESGALERLDAFVDDAVNQYRATRDLPAVPGTSGLSPHLHFGEISPQQALAAIKARGPVSGQAAHFIRELGWREFAHHLLYHFPQTPEQALYSDRFGRFPWRRPDDYADDLRAWQRGQTGIPIVDAGMRQLWATGWMHNRVRMIVASLLTKHLLIPWQAGAHWFWDTLVDASLASNTLGWQWAAGCGADAAPYFRVFNPQLQSEKFDADGAYLKRWVPEVRALPPKAMHARWTASAPPPGYAPIVDLKAGRERALAAYATLKE